MATINEEKSKKRWRLEYYRDGKRYREFYKTKALALEACNKIKRAGSHALTSSEENDAGAALKMLKAAGIEKTLSQVVAMFLNGDSYIEKPRIPVADAVQQYIDSKVALNRAAVTIEELRVRLGRFVREFGNYTMRDLTVADVEKFCVRSHWSPQTSHDVFLVLRGFLSWCSRRDWLSFVPNFDKSAFLPKILKKPKPVFTVEQMKKIFEYLEKNPSDRQFIPFFAVQAFMGLRRAEASRLNWSNIDFKRRIINLPAEIVKTGDAHTLYRLPENLWVWLEKYRGRGAFLSPSSGYIYERLAKYLEAEWQHNGFRHSFATMFVSLTRNQEEAILILRHRNRQRLWQNYQANLLESKDAAPYFEIVPAGTNPASCKAWTAVFLRQNMAAFPQGESRQIAERLARGNE